MESEFTRVQGKGAEKKERNYDLLRALSVQYAKVFHICYSIQSSQQPWYGNPLYFIDEKVKPLKVARVSQVARAGDRL